MSRAGSEIVAERFGENLRRVPPGRPLAGAAGSACLAPPHRGREVGARGADLPRRHADPAGGGEGGPTRRAARRDRLGSRSRAGRCLRPRQRAARRRADVTDDHRKRRHSKKQETRSRVQSTGQRPPPARPETEKAPRSTRAIKEGKRQPHQAIEKHQPRKPTHYEPSGSVPRPQLPDRQHPQRLPGPARAGDRPLGRPILARLRRADGRT